MAELSKAQKNARKAKANMKAAADKKLIEQSARLRGELSAYKRLFKEGWAPKGGQ